jgi:hypothetical protein
MQPGAESRRADGRPSWAGPINDPALQWPKRLTDKYFSFFTRAGQKRRLGACPGGLALPYFCAIQ